MSKEFGTRFMNESQAQRQGKQLWAFDQIAALTKLSDPQAVVAEVKRLSESEAHWRQTSKMLVNTARPLASMAGANSSYDAIQAVADELQATETPHPERNPDEQD